MVARCFLTFVHVVSVVVMVTGSPVKVAVYEHVVISPDNPEQYFTRNEAFQWMSKNLEVLAQQTQAAAKQGAKMIVFPEYGITGFDHSRDSILTFLEDIPDVTAEWNPCIEPNKYPNTRVLRNISCIARDNFMYVVANMGDIKECNDSDVTCPQDGRYQFNTNVVFDRHGKLIARYHKQHMYDETPLFDPSPSTEYVTFNTPFGKFGTIVCFDLLHHKPTQVLMEEYGVTNLVVTSAWNVFYPFVIPLQMYAGLAKRNRVNVIAANIRHSEYYMAGSGIFGNNVEVKSDLNFFSDKGVLLVAEIDTKPDKRRHGKVLAPILKSHPTEIEILTKDTDTLFGTYDYGMNMSYVVMNKMAGYTDICIERVCCAVQYEFKFREPEELFILSAVDVILLQPGEIHMQFCAVHKCASNDPETCGDVVMSANSTFSRLTVQGEFDDGTVFPFVSTTTHGTGGIHMEMDSYIFDHDKAVLQADKLKHPLLAAVVFSSLYNESDIDKEYVYYTGESTNTSCNVILSTLLIVLTIIIHCMFQVKKQH